MNERTAGENRFLLVFLDPEFVALSVLYPLLYDVSFRTTTPLPIWLLAAAVAVQVSVTWKERSLSLHLPFSASALLFYLLLTLIRRGPSDWGVGGWVTCYYLALALIALGERAASLGIRPYPAALIPLVSALLNVFVIWEVAEESPTLLLVEESLWSLAAQLLVIRSSISLARGTHARLARW